MTTDSLANGSPFHSGLVSIIMPTYNRAHLIADSVSSVLEQTYLNLEIIVVDDGSTDNTPEVMAGFSDSRLRYIRQPNRGRSNARNHALSLASGEYVTFLDSDDLYVPKKVEIQVDYLKNHPGTGMVYTSAYCIDEKGEMLEHNYEASVSGLIYPYIAFFTPVTITLPTVMTYRQIIDRVGGFDEKMHRFEDTDMWRRISKYCRIDAMPVKTCLLRTHGDNSLLSQNPQHIGSALDYYATKILSEDAEFDINMRRKGLMGLYLYYAHAFMSVPQFAAKGKELLRIAARYNREIRRAERLGFSRALHAVGRRCGLSTLRFWARWLARLVYYRSANVAYQTYSKAKRFFIGS